MTKKTTKQTKKEAAQNKTGKPTPLPGQSNKADPGPPPPEPECKLSAEAMLKADKKQKAAQGKKEPSSQTVEDSRIGPFKVQTVKNALSANEDGDAHLLIELCRGKYRFDLFEDPRFGWYYWNDHFWRQDVKNEFYRSILDVVEIYEEFRRRQEWLIQKIESGSEPNLSDEEKDKKREEAKYWKKKVKERTEKLQTLNRKNNVARLSAMGLDSLGFVGDLWDTDPWLLGCRNGVLNLKTGEFRNGRPEDNIKTVSPVKYDPEATCPAWEKFIYEVFDGDQETVNFIQRLFGYAITGLRTEHVFPIFWGERGRNGKSTLFETLKSILGEMAYKVNSEVLMQQHTSSADGPSAAMMKFKGARLAWASETNKKDTLNAAQIKAMSGGDTISARNPHGRKMLDFIPTHLLCILVNPRPRVDAEDDALWRRVLLIEMALSFVSNPDPKKPWERLKDPDLLEKLEKEFPGILRWLVEGCYFWQQEGLNPPESMMAATEKYRNEEDLFGNFLKDRCEVDVTNKEYRTKPKDLYVAYKEWCLEGGYKPLNQKHFNESARMKFGETVRVKSQPRTYCGVVVFSNQF